MQKKLKAYLSFGICCLLATIHLLFLPSYYSSSDIQSFIFHIKIRDNTILLFSIAYLWYLTYFSGLKNRWFPITMSGVCSIPIVVNIMSENSLRYANIHSFEHFMVSEISKFPTIHGTVSGWYYIFSIVTIIILGWPVFLGFSLLKKNNKFGAIVLFVGAGFSILTLGVIDNIIFFISLPMPYTIEYGFFPYCVIMSIYLALQFRENYQNLESTVTARTRELNDLREYAEHIVELTPSAIVVFNMAGDVTLWNRRAMDITGYTSKEALGENITKVGLKPGIDTLQTQIPLSNKTREKKACRAKNTQKSTNGSNHDVSKKSVLPEPISNNTLYGYENTITRKDGQIRFILQSFISTSITNIYSFEDITEKKQLEEFRDSVEQIMRHDLKSPLQSIIHLPGIFEGNENLTETEWEVINGIADAGNKMYGMIESSLILLQIEKGTATIDLELVDLEELMVLLTKHFNHHAKMKQVHLRIEISGNSKSTIQANSSMLYSAISNLIKNAIEASPPNEDIILKVTYNKKVTVSVCNIGEVPPEMKPIFFQKYATHGKTTGTGLGTYSAKMMINAMAGAIDFLSENAHTEVRCSFNRSEIN